MTKNKTCSYNVLSKPRMHFVKIRKSYNRDLYEVMGEICEAVAILKTNFKSYKQFAKESYWDDRSEKPKIKERLNKRSLISFGVDYVMRLKDNKLAHKRVRLLEFLIEVRKVPPCDIAAEIAELGGIEKVYRLAVDEDPRRPIQPKVMAEDLEDSVEYSGSDNDEWSEDADESNGCTFLIEADAKTMQKVKAIGKRDAWVKIRALGGLRFQALKVKPATSSN